jgi:hypothetical protein
MAGGDTRRGRNARINASVARVPVPASPVADATIVEPSLSHPEEFAALFDRHYGAIHGYHARRLGAGRADDLGSTRTSFPLNCRQAPVRFLAET